ncbi:HAD-IIB family hydrolase [Candidatus Parcubacteria bacterium]|nr:HAD-IIB family hydrolase [Candidatus Parcubacteria bacterium]
MQPYDIIAFDLDGTLTPSKSPLDSEMSALLVELLKKYKVAVISGAALRQFEKQFLASLVATPSELRNLYIVPTNGANLCQYRIGWLCTHSYELTDEEKKAITVGFEKALAETGFEKPEKLFGDQIEDRGTQVTFSALGMEAPLELKEKWDPDHAKRARIVAALKPMLKDFSIHMGGATSIDVTRKGIDKAYGLNEVLKLAECPPERMLFVGDELRPDGNDAPALTIGCQSRAVKGPKETKEVIQGLLA